MTSTTCPASSTQELLRPKFSISRLTFSSLLFLLQVHNRNLLSLDFDRVTRTEKIYDDHRKFTLRILYDQSGRPSLWSPSSRLNGVNVTYSPGGHIAGVQRGIMSERMEYDQAGRITSKIFADGKTWSYTYLEKAGVCLSPSVVLPCRRPVTVAQPMARPCLLTLIGLTHMVSKRKCSGKSTTEGQGSQEVSGWIMLMARQVGVLYLTDWSRTYTAGLGVWTRVGVCSQL